MSNAKVVITTESICDLPPKLLKKYHLNTIPYYIYTKDGRFKDHEEISTSNMVEYLNNSTDSPYSSHASVAEFYDFFKQHTPHGENLIHLCLASQVPTSSYLVAQEAALKLPNVYVIDSGHISGSLALLAIQIAKMALDGYSVEMILTAIPHLKNTCYISAILNNTDYIFKNNLYPKPIRHLFTLPFINPVFELKNSKLTLCKMLVAPKEYAIKSHLKYIFKNKHFIDTSILLVTTDGCSHDFELMLLDEIKKYYNFKEILFTTIAPSIICNCGPNTFSLAFLLKKEIS